ncbi:LysR family transcriptional regulator [Amycolatopsis keratiniphila]|uniref:LysR family transcriptional regulator n=1 Tax=Amycolatopsis keratiniphila TaxID=129921 RepID=UPI0018D49117|nr:LysR family transcriptional regulator [Amycolatopsis keratiniphila]
MHQLQIFLTLAEELHFGRAATRMHMSQPALSRQVSALERWLGVEVVSRTSRSVNLTHAGQVLLIEAQAVIHAMCRLRRVAAEHSQGLGGKLIIGTVGAEASMEHTVAVLREMRQRHPALELDVRLLDLADQFSSLTTGQADVVFCRPPAPGDVETHHLSTEPRVACVPDDDPLASRDKVFLHELDDRVVISHPPECPRDWREFWAVDPRPSRAPVRYGRVVRDVESLLAEVAQGGGICFLPAAARSFFPRPGVVYLDVTDLSPCTSALAWHVSAKDRPHIAAIRRAAQAVRPKREPYIWRSPTDLHDREAATV